MPTRPKMFQKNNLKTNKLVSFYTNFTWWVSKKNSIKMTEDKNWHQPKKNNTNWK